MPAGAFRQVIFLGCWAVKVPRLRNFRAGLLCNAWEYEAWTTWRPQFGWRDLCPVLFAGPWGLFVVMPRADDSVTEEELAADAAADDECYPASDAELKIGNVGRLRGRIVAFDYGLPDSASIYERRKYYRDMAARKRTEKD